MDERHWRFLATIPYAAFVCFVAATLLLPRSLASGPALAAAALGGGGLVAALLSYAGGYERLGWEGPGRDDLVELLVVVSMAALFGVAAGALVRGALPEPWITIVPVLVGLIVGQYLFERIVEPRLGGDRT